MNKILQRSRCLLAVALAMGGCSALAQSSQLVTLQNFGQKFGSAEIDTPGKDLLTASDGTFYGIYGNYQSSVFHLMQSGAVNQVADLSYTNDCYYIGSQLYCDVTYLQPGSLIQGTDSNLYASGFNYFNNTTNGSGNVVSLTTTGQWRAFGLAPGSATGPMMQGTDGKLYGVSFNSLFSMTTAGQLTNLHAFSSLDGAGHNQDGYYPLGGLTLGADGNYYGTTSQGGLNGVGTLFKVTTSGVFTKLRDFTAASGSKPESTMILANDGNFYGTTLNGGTYGNGVIFKLTPAGVYSVVHSFTSSEGIGPAFRLVEADKGTTQTLYGTTIGGGANNTGTIYSYTTAGKFLVQHAFSAADANGDNGDGISPNGLTVGLDGNVFGTAAKGGTFGKGTAFELIVQAPKVTMTLSPKKVAAYQNATITWSSTSTTSCTASGAWSGSEPLSGTQVVMQPVSGSYVYKLTCYGPYGSASKSVTLTVN